MNWCHKQNKLQIENEGLFSPKILIFWFQKQKCRKKIKVKACALNWSIFTQGSHKKNTKLWTLSKHGGAAIPFIEKRQGHVLRGEGGSSFFVKKFVLGVPEKLLCVKIIYILHAQKLELQYHIPIQALSEKFYFLIFQKLIL